MRTWMPIGLVAVVALGGLLAGVRSADLPVVEPAPAPPSPPSAVNQPRRSPEPPPPLEILAVRAEQKQLPAPPPVNKATEHEIKEYVEKVESLARGKDPETIALANDLVRRIKHDAREWQTEEHRRKTAERRAEQQKAHDAVREAHRKEHPAPAPKPADPNRVPPPSPLQGPPLTGVEPPPEKKK